MKEEINIPQIKLVDDDFEVEFNIGFHDEFFSDKLENLTIEKEIEKGISDVNKSIEINDNKIAELNEEIGRLTNNADGLDYTIAVSSGIIASLIDVFWVGEFNLERGRKWSDEKINNIVVKIAQKQGYKGDSLEDSITFLEKKFPLASDSNTADFGGGLQHHLRDFAHHPSIFGLFFSMLTQFTGKAYGTKTNGSFMIVDVKNKKLIGEDLPQKILFGTVFWFFHLVSDMAGSSNSPGAGTGIPGPLLSFAKLLSSLPIFKNTQTGDNKFSLLISKLFNGTLLAKRDENGKIIPETVKRFDFRAEIGVVYELGRQAVPVIINECVVRSFYFLRRFTKEIKTNNISKLSELNQINWKNTLPFNNRTIARMLTIATGTFTLIDLGDAAIRGAIKSGGNMAVFTKEFILRVNFVGVGRFVIAVGVDVTMGVQKEKRRNERIFLMSQQLHLMNARIFYFQANTWKSAENTLKSIEEVKVLVENTFNITIKTWKQNKKSIDNIGNYVTNATKYNPNLDNDILDILN